MGKVRFEASFPGAKAVFVAGDFNEWDASARRMKRVKKGEDGFLAVLELEPGRYEFKYVVDGEWVCCPCAERVTTEDGFENSVVVVEEEVVEAAEE
jgi:1,4-alpha-glucan branching enzyme